MKDKNEIDVLKIFDNFHRTLQKKPSQKQMMDEVRMMKFKVRPMQGDALLFNMFDERLIEVLWNLGKLDELFHSQYQKLSQKNKQLFFRIFDSMYEKLQSELNRINLRRDKASNISPVVEIEIFKERAKKKLN